MKSFSQFLQESYLSEEIPAGMTRAQYNALPSASRRRLSGGSESAMGRQGQPLRGAASAPAIRSARQGMSGQQAAAVGGVTAAGGAATLANTAGDNPAKPRLDDRLDRDIKTSKVKSPAGAVRDPWTQFPKKSQPQLGMPKTGPSSPVPGRILAPAGGTSAKDALPAAGSTSSGGREQFTIKTPEVEAEIRRQRAARREARAAAYNAKNSSVTLATRGTNPQAPPEAMMRGAYDKASTPRTSSGGSGGSGGKPPALPAARQTGGKPPAGPKIKVPAGAGKALRVGGKLLGPAAAALDVADERAKGSGWLRSLAKGATVAAGGALGGAAGSIAGPVGSIGGATAGSIAASKAFDVAAGANAKERAAMAAANRQRQAGTAIKGIGGKTTFDTKKNTMTTGVGSQQKTVGLAKTGVVQRGGQSTAGHLAYKGGQAVYKAGPSAQSLAKTSSNPLERIGRTMFAGAYKKHDAAKAQQALQKARQSDAARNKALGVKFKPGG